MQACSRYHMQFLMSYIEQICLDASSFGLFKGFSQHAGMCIEKLFESSEQLCFLFKLLGSCLWLSLYECTCIANLFPVLQAAFRFRERVLLHSPTGCEAHFKDICTIAHLLIARMFLYYKVSAKLAKADYRPSRSLQQFSSLC